MAQYGTSRAAVLLASVFAAALASLLLVSPAFAVGSRQEASSMYAQWEKDQQTPPGWTGSTDTCTVGTESQASLDATRSTLNILRQFAGLGPVTFSDEKNHRALAAALMMKAQGDLSHDPPPTWACYSPQGYSGASTSNLYLGSSGPSAMVGYVDDSGVDSLGHRRWVLDPDAMEMGSGSTGGSNALVVIGNGGDGSRAAAVAADSAVAWPAPGWFPSPWIFNDWSVALGNDSTQSQISVANAQVKVEVDGKPATVSGVQDLGASFGTGSTLTWRVALSNSILSGDHEIEVSITGATLNNTPFPVEYTVKAFDPQSSGEGPDASPCEQAKAKLAKAKEKLKQAKKSGSKAKVQHAKQKVKKAKKRKRDAC